MKNECLAAVIRVLRENGITHPTITNGGRHLHVKWQTPRGEERMKPVATTPSDVFGPTKAAADVRRILRADNMLLDAPEPRAPARQLSRLERLERRLQQIEAKLGLTASV